MMNSHAGAVVKSQEELKTERFLHWLHENGAVIPSVKIDSPQGLRGLYATRPFERGELVIQIPGAIHISAEVAKASPIGELIKAKCSGFTNQGYLAAFLLDQRRGESFWKPYFDMLPTEAADHPCMFSRDELAYLNGTCTMRTVVEQRQQIAHEWEQLNSCLPGERRFSLREYFTTRCVVMARTYALTVDGAESSEMIPLAEMCNHSFDYNLDWNREPDQPAGFVATKRIEAGMPVLFCYGQKSNGMLFSYYGFCLDNNPNNDAEIELPTLPPSHRHYSRAAGMGAMRKNRRVFTVQANYNAPAAQSMFSFLRLQCQEDEVDVRPQAEYHITAERQLLRLWLRIRSKEMSDAFPVAVNEDEEVLCAPLDRDHEIAALTTLAAACQHVLDRFDASIEEDDVLLAGSDLPRKLRYAVMVRQQEKRILKYYRELAQTAIPVLQDPASDLARYAGSEKPFAEYFADLSKHLGKRKEQEAVRELNAA